MSFFGSKNNVHANSLGKARSLSDLIRIKVE